MKKPFKQGLLLLLTVLIGLSLLLRFTTLNFLKPTVVAKLAAYTGSSVQIKGNISLGLWPTLTLTVDRLVVANPVGFGDQPLAELAHVSVGLAVMPLLKHQLQLKAVSLNGLHLHLITNQQGQGNWTVFRQQLPHQPVTPVQPAKTTTPAVDGLGINTLNVADATITWQNQQKGRDFTLSGLHLSLDRLVSPDFSHFTVSAKLAGSHSKLSHQFKLQGLLDTAAPYEKIKLTELLLDNRVSGVKIPGGSLHLAAKLERADYDRLARHVEFDGLSMEWQHMLVTEEQNMV